tara:strand:- start:2981 stop:3229 length:249 start_codon:yes stop_codon:yes gene_type:complete
MSGALRKTNNPRRSINGWRINKMKTYKVSWQKGRLSGAQGIYYPDSVIVQAHNPAAARLKAYDTHEHLMFVTVTEMDESNVD